MDNVRVNARGTIEIKFIDTDLVPVEHKDAISNDMLRDALVSVLHEVMGQLFTEHQIMIKHMEHEILEEGN